MPRYNVVWLPLFFPASCCNCTALVKVSQFSWKAKAAGKLTLGDAARNYILELREVAQEEE